MEVVLGLCVPISVVLLIASCVRFVLLMIVTTGFFIDKPIHKNESLLDSNLVNIGNVLYQLSLTLQHVALIYGLSNFYSEMQPTDFRSNSYNPLLLQCFRLYLCSLLLESNQYFYGLHIGIIMYVLALFVAPMASYCQSGSVIIYSLV